MLQLLWDSVRVWHDACLENDKRPRFGSIKDTAFWEQFRPIVCHRISGRTIYAIFSGEARRSITETFAPFPPSVWGNNMPRNLLSADKQQTEAREDASWALGYTGRTGRSWRKDPPPEYFVADTPVQDIIENETELCKSSHSVHDRTT
jgi:hypothetical protein